MDAKAGSIEGVLFLISCDFDETKSFTIIISAKGSESTPPLV